ncbi:DNA repair ATPase [Streptomyces sp. SID13666]|nr:MULTISPECIES: DNA repair ATPase [unclassified Streptomyces]NEA55732.1 DNA repair ATPase [Streptomyces sp. SID13666]NEA73183.1 DNA repair ATPase [Streptomyces sp. SID13588]
MEVSETRIDAGTYEVLRDRLAASARTLAVRAEALNARRQEVFGSAELRLAGTDRISTGHACVPCDIAPVGERLLFGANPAPGGRTDGQPAVGEVLSVQGEPVPGLLDDPRFVRDFDELYRYYRQTRLTRLRPLDGRLLAVFRTGPAVDDVRVLRWRLSVDGSATYVDARGERDHVVPPTHDFTWTEATREDHVPGAPATTGVPGTAGVPGTPGVQAREPHIALPGGVSVSVAGGTLTVNDHTEPVDEPLQSLADAEVAYAVVGPLLVLRVRPYKETAWRHLVVHTRTGDVARLDAIGQACRRLPEEQGIIFPGGYCLATGAMRTFDDAGDVGDLEPESGFAFERLVRSANGEDLLYVFHAAATGRRLLLPYNMISMAVATPIRTHGYALFEDGTLVTMRAAGDEPTRVHPLHRWQTPYLSDSYAAAQPVGTGPLERIGNPDLVRGISDCLSVAATVADTAPAAAVFAALAALCARVLDRYHWLGEAESGDLRGPLQEVRSTAEQVLAEYEQVQSLTARAAEAVEEAAARIASVVRRARGEAPKSAADWVDQLSELRAGQGRLETLRELRYADRDRIGELAAGLDADLTAVAHRAVAHLSREDAFADYRERVERAGAEAEVIAVVADAVPVAERLAEQAAALETVTGIVGTLEIADATVRTGILARIADVLGGVNRARALLDARRRELLTSEGRAEFAAELALLAQSVSSARAAAETPEACDEQLGRLLVQLENLEARFAEWDEYLAELGTRREEIHETFSARRQTLTDERARRTERLAGSAARILVGVRRRAAGLATLDEINTYFASDPMAAKVRKVADELRALGDPARGTELDGHLAAARQDAGRALRDRLDLYDAGGAAIRLGRHRFAVNTQPLDLALVPHEGGLAFTVTGTDYRAPVRDAVFAATRRFWDRPLVSESPDVYRAEYLAATLLPEVPPGADDGELAALVRAAASSRLDEGYERGVHDHDTVTLLRALLDLHSTAGLLRYPSAVRAAAQLFWTYGPDAAARTAWTTRATSLTRARGLFGPTPALADLAEELAACAGEFLAGAGLADVPRPRDGLGLLGEYLVEELATPRQGFIGGAPARVLRERFAGALGGPQAVPYKEFTDDLQALGGDLAARYRLAEAWLGSFGGGEDRAEAVTALVCGEELTRYESEAVLSATVDGLLGAHPRIDGRSMTVRLDEVLTRTGRFRTEEVPAYRAYQHDRAALVAAERARLRLEDFRPRALNGFVRNGLLDEVHLPLIGDNLAKQLGTAGTAGAAGAGDGEKADRMGLLMLMSPPGYGKTTLMEYVASRLGLVLVRVDGPALGSAVTSLDPERAPDATARREVEKINFALELGTNTLLYLDDIQHTSPELLQKFIPLCDAQRRVEGVRDGRAHSYDLRGKRFAVCMAGNPYTESGRVFRVPDMLANRADVWNLGDAVTGREALFALSYLENALTSNEVLAPLSTRDRADLELLVRLAEGDPTARADRLVHPYEQGELDRILAVLRHLLRVRGTVLAVNAQYIASAGQADATRTEPPFLLQGSYRNMNKLSERIVPAMNEAEVEAVIDDHYRAEAQTLAGGAEAALLKLAALRGRQTAEQAARWAEVKGATVVSAGSGAAAMRL